MNKAYALEFLYQNAISPFGIRSLNNYAIDIWNSFLGTPGNTRSHEVHIRRTAESARHSPAQPLQTGLSEGWALLTEKKHIGGGFWRRNIYFWISSFNGYFITRDDECISITDICMSSLPFIPLTTSITPAASGQWTIGPSSVVLLVLEANSVIHPLDIRRAVWIMGFASCFF